MNLGSQIPVNKQSVMPSSSAASRNSTGTGNSNVSDQFPAGLRVLVVDDDPTCLMILEKMLRSCKYEVTKCNRAEVALSLLRENKNGFDVVISDVHMPDMDGFKLLVHIGLEMDLPVIMMSADDSKSVVMKGVTHGACDYLIKPVRIEALRNIWQHVVRKRKHEWKDLEPSTSLDEVDRNPKLPEDHDRSSSANEGHNCKNTKRRKDDEDEAEERDDSSSLKKPRVVWSVELHEQFVAAVTHLGIDKAVPKKILDLMNVPGLTRENVASHLQKYRIFLKRLSVSQQPGGINTSFMGNPDSGYGSISSISEFDRQALSISGQLGQLPGQSLAVSIPLVDQRNTFSFQNQMRYSQVQNRQGHNSNLLHGIPTTMEPKQLVGLQRSFVGMNSQSLIPLTGQSQMPVFPNPTGSLSQPSSMVNFPLRGSLGILSNNVNRNRPPDWDLQSTMTELPFDASQHGYVSGQRIGGSKVILPTGEGSVTGTHVVNNPSQFTTAEYGQDDLLTKILTQSHHQDGIGQGENEFSFDWYSLDNLV